VVSRIWITKSLQALRWWQSLADIMFSFSGMIAIMKEGA
jgi:hypothetical protein